MAKTGSYISFEAQGSFRHLDNYLQKMSKRDILSELAGYGREGVAALQRATPVDSGITADSWAFNVTSSRGWFFLNWTNDHVVDGTPLVIMLQYGHGTGTGGYVQGYDFINPAIRPIFDRISADMWKAVTSV